MRRLKRLSVLLFIVSLIMLGSHIFKVRMLDDRTGPVFQMDSRTIEVSVKDGQEALVKGLTATDAKDGDISDSIIVESIGPFTGTGSRIVNYAALDSDNHVTHTKREMVYTDYEPSRFHLSRPLSFAMNTVNLLNGISVEDSIDGDLTRNVRMMSDSEIDTAHVGEYSARLKATNSAGGISYLPVTVEIYDASVFHRLPLLNLKEYVAYVEKGADFDERNYLTSIVINGTSYSLTEEEGTYENPVASQGETRRTISYDMVDIESEVDTDVTGYYEVLYTFEDTISETGTGKVRLYVVVTDGGKGTR